jgi:hypothetical protein
MLFISCGATHNAPTAWLPKPEETVSDSYGAWIEINSLHGSFRGELIAVTEDTVFVAHITLFSVATADITSARLVLYDTGRSLAVGRILGFFSTFSNGAFLLFTAPMWLIGGTIAVINRSYDPIVDYPKKPLNEFKPFARYPQGIPEQINRSEISMKKLRKEKSSR